MRWQCCVSKSPRRVPESAGSSQPTSSSIHSGEGTQTLDLAPVPTTQPYLLRSARREGNSWGGSVHNASIDAARTGLDAVNELPMARLVLVHRSGNLAMTQASCRFINLRPGQTTHSHGGQLVANDFPNDTVARQWILDHCIETSEHRTVEQLG